MKWIKGIVAMCLLIGAGYYFYMQYKPEPPLPVESQSMISFTVTEETITEELQVKGKSVYAEETQVYAPISAKIVSRNKKNGQQLKKGDIIMELDTEAIQKEIKQLESDIKKARLDIKLKQVTQAVEAETEEIGVTGEERKKAFIAREGKRLTDEINEEAIVLKEDELKEKRKLLDKAVIFSPSSGVFLYNEPDDKTSMLAEGQLIGKIVNLDQVDFAASVSEKDIIQLKPGMQVKVQMSGRKDKEFLGKIQSISQFPKTSSNATDTSQLSQFDVVIAMKADKLLIGGLTLEGRIETFRKEKAAVVSALAIMREGELVYVMRDQGNGQIERQDIETGIEFGDQIEVLKGLKPGDVVVMP
ncbi:membrane fusion protein, macrolide-specific efflux system [Paenibacillus algorifonticola]|uniref:Membrane fusion protein, macrolide-specific efflux system n=1 Tax=Paenibacillus algorifonticola TaxID=684063 RepID=A0A1I2F785_9BACL|nr:efflux RND transporter periplasmic adaptor subunit [Paenibacillus algorifonticola]SFF00883.1 membrane fusion protein, macrolide-specific efflux system [Paenibacillus algorifonticola]